MDYSGTKFSKNKGFVVIEFKNPTSNIDHPFNTQRATDALPYTHTGMIGSKHNIIPEYYSPDIIKFDIGDVLRVYNKNGKIIDSYIIKENKLTGKTIWKRL